MKDRKSPELRGDVFFAGNRQESFAAAQIDLLRAIDERGSISQAAKQIGISYKTAWDRVDAMNNMAEKPLVVRSAGGAHGGGTSLTDFGQRILAGFESLQREHARFIDQLGSRVHSLTDIANFMRSGLMRSSARNQFRGRIKTITPGVVNTEVELDIGADQSLIAIITAESAAKLQLAENARVVALIKASSVIISTDTSIKTSARNKLVGTVSRLVPGAVNSEVVIDIGGDKSVCAMITDTSFRELGLQEGQPACALFKAPSVILLKE